MDYLLYDSVRAGKYVGLPEAKNHPTRFLQKLGVFDVALNIAFNLGDPVVRIRAIFQLCSALRPVSPMPEVAITEDRDLGFREDDVRPTRQSDEVLSESATDLPERTPQHELAFGVGLLA